MLGKHCNFRAFHSYIPQEFLLSLISIANSQPRMNVYPGKDFFLHLPNFAAPFFLLNLRTLFPPVTSFLFWVTDGRWEWLWYFVIMGRVNSGWDSNSKWFSFWAGHKCHISWVMLSKSNLSGFINMLWKVYSENVLTMIIVIRHVPLSEFIICLRAAAELVGTSAPQSTSLTAVRLAVTRVRNALTTVPHMSSWNSFLTSVYPEGNRMFVPGLWGHWNFNIFPEKYWPTASGNIASLLTLQESAWPICADKSWS